MSIDPLSIDPLRSLERVDGTPSVEDEGGSRIRMIYEDVYKEQFGIEAVWLREREFFRADDIELKLERLINDLEFLNENKSLEEMMREEIKNLYEQHQLIKNSNKVKGYVKEVSKIKSVGDMVEYLGCSMNRSDFQDFADLLRTYGSHLFKISVYGDSVIKGCDYFWKLYCFKSFKNLLKSSGMEDKDIESILKDVQKEIKKIEKKLIKSFLNSMIMTTKIAINYFKKIPSIIFFSFKIISGLYFFYQDVQDVRETQNLLEELKKHDVNHKIEKSEISAQKLLESQEKKHKERARELERNITGLGLEVSEKKISEILSKQETLSVVQKQALKGISSIKLKQLQEKVKFQKILGIIDVTNTITSLVALTVCEILVAASIITMPPLALILMISFFSSISLGCLLTGYLYMIIHNPNTLKTYFNFKQWKLAWGEASYQLYRMKLNIKIFSIYKRIKTEDKEELTKEIEDLKKRLQEKRKKISDLRNEILKARVKDLSYHFQIKPGNSYYGLDEILIEDGKLEDPLYVGYEIADYLKKEMGINIDKKYVGEQIREFLGADASQMLYWLRNKHREVIA